MSGGGSRGRIPSPNKGLEQGEGEIAALKRKEDFEGRPY